MPFLRCTAGGSQLIDSEVELSAVITKFWGAPLGTAKMKSKVLINWLLKLHNNIIIIALFSVGQKYIYLVAKLQVYHIFHPPGL